MLDPIVNLFRSRTFVSSIVAAVFAVIVTQVPSLSPYTDTIVPLLVTLIIAIAGGEAVENASKASVEAERERTAQAQIHLETARVQRVVDPRG